jgi:hypothetical protein
MAHASLFLTDDIFHWRFVDLCLCLKRGIKTGLILTWKDIIMAYIWTVMLACSAFWYAMLARKYNQRYDYLVDSLRKLKDRKVISESEYSSIMNGLK